MELTDRVRDIAEEYAKERGIEIIEITFRREHQGMVLRVIADRPEGIKMSECEALNNFLSEELEKEDPIQEHYILEVSSPGLDRPIKTDKDFDRSMGKVIELTTYEMIEGRKTHEGTLVGMDKDTIVVESGGISVVIPKNKVALARLKIDF